jgi:HEAT repeat protein
MEFDRFWTLADYQRFIQDPDFFARDWAANRIEEQYPQQAAQSLLNLLKDEDDHLRISASRAIIASPDPEFEEYLLDALPTARSYARRWILEAIGAVGCRAILSQLIRDCNAIPDRHRTGTESTENLGIVKALGYYPELEAQAALWRLLERYQHDDVLANATVASLLKHPDPDTFVRLTRLIQKMRPAEERIHFSVIDAIAEACQVHPLVNHLYGNLGDPLYALETLEGWMDGILEFDDKFVSSFYKKARQGYRSVLEVILSEADRYCTERGQQWNDWNDVWNNRPIFKSGYLWRMAIAYQMMAAFEKNPPQAKSIYRRAVGVCLSLLGQFIIDENDEAILEGALTPEEELGAFVGVLNSPRQNVFPNIVDRLAARGPAVLPVLVAALQQEEYFWPRVRALETITRLAQLYPGAADPAIPAILDQFQEEGSDYVLEAAEQALKTIGPAMVEPAVERIDYEDYTTYNIYILGALGEIPTEASLQALIDYHERAEEVDEFFIEVMAGLAQPRTLPLLRSYYQEDPDPNLAEFCYKVAYLNQIDDPLLTQWKAEALENRVMQKQIIENLEAEWAPGQAAKREKSEHQPWENIISNAFTRSREEPVPEDGEEEEREKIGRARKKEAERRAEAKAKAKRRQEKKSRKKSRKRK